jgi:hypothetical protein
VAHSSNLAVADRQIPNSWLSADCNLAVGNRQIEEASEWNNFVLVFSIICLCKGTNNFRE